MTHVRVGAHCTTVDSFSVPCSYFGQTHFWYPWEKTEEIMIQTDDSNSHVGRSLSSKFMFVHVL